MPSSGPSDNSLTLTQEYFDCQDNNFLNEFRKLDSIKILAGFADKWKKDPRPWARRQLIKYLTLPLNRPGHHPVIKRIFKYAEENRDHALMAVFMVAFDRSVRRQRRTRMFFDTETNQWIQEEFLSAPRNSLRAKRTRTVRDPYTGKTREFTIVATPDSRLFSVHTRHYLRRRAWRYFRRLGYKNRVEYIKNISFALKRYTDEDFSSGENILDNWGLMHALYHEHEGLSFKSHAVTLEEGRSISELAPAPYFPEYWKDPSALDTMLSLVKDSHSGLVRSWAMDGLKLWHREALEQLDPEALLVLFKSEFQDVQEFGAELLGKSKGLASAKVDVWLKLLKTTNPNALAIICDHMKRLVSSDRLNIDQMIDLACAEPSPVAQMGLSFLKETQITDKSDQTKLAKLAQVSCPAYATDITDFALSFYQTDDDYDVEVVSEFFDSLLPGARDRAFAWILEFERAYWDPFLWNRLMETPFPDLRIKISNEMEKNRGKKIDISGPLDLERIWIVSLMDPHRGANQRPGVIRRIKEAIKNDAGLLDRFLPLLIFAARSVRNPEKRAGLAAILELIELCPDQAPKILGKMPELSLVSNGGD